MEECVTSLEMYGCMTSLEMTSCDLMRRTKTSDLLINGVKLPGPPDVVEKLAVVVAIVVGAVAFRVVRRCEGGHLMPIDGVGAEEMLHFVGHLGGGVFVGPRVDQLAEHGVRTAAGDLAEPAKVRELRIRHSHILLMKEKKPRRFRRKTRNGNANKNRKRNAWTNNQKIIGKWSKNDRYMIRKWSKNNRKMIEKWNIK